MITHRAPQSIAVVYEPHELPEEFLPLDLTGVELIAHVRGVDAMPEGFACNGDPWSDTTEPVHVPGGRWLCVRAWQRPPEKVAPEAPADGPFKGRIPLASMRFHPRECLYIRRTAG